MADWTLNLPAVAGAVAAAIALPLILRTVRPDAEVLGSARVLAYGRPLKLLIGFF